jgi:prevent-host-death family protein
MLKHLTITEAQQQILHLPDDVQQEPIIITKHGKPVMAAISFEQYESLLETLAILSENAVIPHPSTGWGCKAGKN